VAGGPVGHKLTTREPCIFFIFLGWVGPKGTSTGCLRQFAWEYVGIILDLLYVVYAEITYNFWGKVCGSRGAVNF
jgi:hypothetical protein